MVEVLISLHFKPLTFNVFFSNLSLFMVNIYFQEGRKRKGDEDILPLLSPRERTAHLQRKAAKDKYRERPSTAPAVLEDSTTEDEGPIQPSEIYYDDDTQKIYYRVSNDKVNCTVDSSQSVLLQCILYQNSTFNRDSATLILFIVQCSSSHSCSLFFKL